MRKYPLCGAQKTKPIFALPSVKTIEAGHEMGIIRRKRTLYEVEVKYAIEPS